MRTAKPSKTLLILAALFSAVAAFAACALATGPGVPKFVIAAQCSALAMGISLGPCLALYALASPRRKQRARKLVLLFGGLSILAFSFLASASIDLHGFFLLLLEGTAGAAIGHTVATLLLGPLFFGRILCGWGCWRAMVLEMLPVRRGAVRTGSHGRTLPAAALLITFGISALSFFAFGHRAGGVPGSQESAGLRSLLAEAAVFYGLSIALAFLFRDQRAFCKYLCPSAAILRLTSRFALMKIAPDPEACNACGACSRVCPMDIDVASLAGAGRRVGTGDCILCQRCVNSCPKGALATTLWPGPRRHQLRADS